MKWFKHDSNSSMDAKLKKLRIKYGMEGYGVYWYCLELVASGIDKHNLTFELEHDSEILANDTGIHQDVIQEMITYMVKLELFTQVSSRIFCMSMQTKADEYTQTLMRESQRNLDKLPTSSLQTPDSVPINSRQSRDKVPVNRREEKRTEEKRTVKGRFSPPTQANVKDYWQEKKLKGDPTAFYDHFMSNGWQVSGKTPMKNWQAAARQWSRRENTDIEDDPLKGYVQ